MCTECVGEPVVSRRYLGRVAGAAGLAVLAAGLGPSGSAVAAEQPTVPAGVRVAGQDIAAQILPRELWAEGREPRGSLEGEQVEFLLVHHTAEPGNGYREGDVPRLLRGIYDFHTGGSKGWPDVAYNFFVDAFGRIWEGRTGSIEGPVRGSATGGNQGWSQLCCFLGNFDAELPTPAAQSAMVALLAWLAERYEVDTSPGATVQVTSLGSNRWPAGETMAVPTIAAHRDTSMTSCPGEACFGWVRDTLPLLVTAQWLSAATVAADAPPAEVSGATTVPTAQEAPSTTSPVTTSPVTTSTVTTAPPQATVPVASSGGGPSRAHGAGDGTETAQAAGSRSTGGGAWPLAGVVLACAAGLAGAARVATRRHPAPLGDPEIGEDPGIQR